MTSKTLMQPFQSKQLGMNLCDELNRVPQVIFLRIKKEKISWLKFILEGYDGMATLSTLSVTDGLVSIWTTHSYLPTLFDLLEELSIELNPYAKL